MHLWAVVKIQRAFRKYRLRGEARQAAKKKVSNTKERWKKKAEGDKYQPPPPEPSPPPPPAPASSRRRKPKSRSESTAVSIETEEDYMRRHRKDFMDDVSEDNDYVQQFYDQQKNADGAVGGIYRFDLEWVRQQTSKQVTYYLLQEKEI